MSGRTVAVDMPPRVASVRRPAAWFAWSGALALALAILLAHGRFAEPGLLGAVGVVALWRYGWGGFHVARALVYQRLILPRLRRRAEAAPLAPLRHVHVIVCSYRIPPAQSWAVYSALFANCRDTGLPATIVAAVTSDEDCALIAEILRAEGAPPNISVVVQFQEGVGKRAAIGAAMRRIVREHPDPRSVLVMLDGDVVLPPGTLRTSLGFMAADPALGALTTDNDGIFAPGDRARHWYRLRFAQRHLLMSSLALSRRLLVLTGRFSVYRTGLVTDPACIELVERDQLHHWLHGRIRFLSGDDKSLWLHVLNSGRPMLYLPQLKAISFESLPAGQGFFGGSTQLMLRWLGNMVRANSRALPLGPRRSGPLLWWCLVDQRLSVLTALSGPAFAIALAATVHPVYLLLYPCWVLVTRSCAALVCGSLWGRFHPVYPLLLAYGQLWGAVLKLHLFLRPDRQSWTRQNIALRRGAALPRVIGNLLFSMALAGLVGAACVAGGLVS